MIIAIGSKQMELKSGLITRPSGELCNSLSYFIFAYKPLDFNDTHTWLLFGFARFFLRSKSYWFTRALFL